MQPEITLVWGSHFTWNYMESLAKTFLMTSLFTLHPSLFHLTSGELVDHVVCFRCFEPWFDHLKYQPLRVALGLPQDE